MGGWDSHTDHDFYVRAYSNKLESKRFLVKCYNTNNPHTRLFKVLGTNLTVAITRAKTTYSHTMCVDTHTIFFPPEIRTENIVCNALTDDNFILVTDNAESEPLF